MILSSTAKPFLAFTVDNEPGPHRLNVRSYQTIYLILFVGEVRATFNTIRYVVGFGVMFPVVPSLSGNTSYLRDFSKINLNKLIKTLRLWKPSCMDIWGQCIVKSGVLWEIWITVARGGSDSAVGYLAAFHSKFWMTFQLGWHKSCRKKIIPVNLLRSKGVEIYKRPDVSISLRHAVKKGTILKTGGFQFKWCARRFPLKTTHPSSIPKKNDSSYLKRGKGGNKKLKWTKHCCISSKKIKSFFHCPKDTYYNNCQT